MYEYRKKPVVIEAWHWLFDNTQKPSPPWMDDAIGKQPGQPNSAAFEPDHPDGPRICIMTLEGVITARPGDWIIKGVAGELYPCKSDIFEATYEPA